MEADTPDAQPSRPIRPCVQKRKLCASVSLVIKTHGTGEQPGCGQEGAKDRFKVGKKKCRLGVRNEHGTRVFDFRKGEQDALKWGHMGIMLKTTSLEREVSLNVEMRIMSEYVQRFGMRKWDAYKENRESINNTIIFLTQKLERYRDRRLKFGLFYLAPHPTRMDMIVLSHLKNMPLKEALRRSRQELEKRKCILEKYNSSKGATASTSFSPISKLVIYTVSSMILGCIILFC
ncbi:hypothetical protein EJB05_36594, partial [Eragrostis curvula]